MLGYSQRSRTVFDVRVGPCLAHGAWELVTGDLMHAGNRDAATLTRTSSLLTNALEGVMKDWQAGPSAAPPSSQNADAALDGDPATEGADAGGMMPGDSILPIPAAEHHKISQTVREMCADRSAEQTPGAGADVDGLRAGRDRDHPERHHEQHNTLGAAEHAKPVGSDQSAEACGAVRPSDCQEEGQPGAADSVQAVRLRKGAWRKRCGRPKGAAGAEPQAATVVTDGTHAAAAGVRVTRAKAADAQVARGVPWAQAFFSIAGSG